MRKQTFFQRIFQKVLKALGIIKEFEVDKSKMCRRAVDSGVCPNCCEKCAWNASK